MTYKMFFPIDTRYFAGDSDYAAPLISHSAPLDDLSRLLLLLQ